MIIVHACGSCNKHIYSIKKKKNKKKNAHSYVNVTDSVVLCFCGSPSASTYEYDFSTTVTFEIMQFEVKLPLGGDKVILKSSETV